MPDLACAAAAARTTPLAPIRPAISISTRVIRLLTLPQFGECPAFMSTRPNPTLAELLMPLPAANPFSTMRASLRWYSSEELEDGVTYGGQSWLRRGSVDSFFSALLLRDGDAAGRRKRSSS